MDKIEKKKDRECILQFQMSKSSILKLPLSSCFLYNLTLQPIYKHKTILKHKGTIK
jgi:hypothetical protein